MMHLRKLIGESINSKERSEKIKQDGQWVIADGEGSILAQVLNIPLRVITCNEDNQIEVRDELYHTNDQNGTEWNSIAYESRPTNYICMVDVGGHFMYGSRSNF